MKELNNTKIFKNTIETDLKKEYIKAMKNSLFEEYVKKIHLLSKKQFTIIMYQNRKITDYNFMLLNISNVKKFEIFVKQYSEHDSFT